MLGACSPLGGGSTWLYGPGEKLDFANGYSIVVPERMEAQLEMLSPDRGDYTDPAYVPAELSGRDGGHAVVGLCMPKETADGEDAPRAPQSLENSRGDSATADPDGSRADVSVEEEVEGTGRILLRVLLWSECGCMEVEVSGFPEIDAAVASGEGEDDLVALAFKVIGLGRR